MSEEVRANAPSTANNMTRATTNVIKPTVATALSFTSRYVLIRLPMAHLAIPLAERAVFVLLKHGLLGGHVRLMASEARTALPQQALVCLQACRIIRRVTRYAKQRVLIRQQPLHVS